MLSQRGISPQGAKITDLDNKRKILVNKIQKLQQERKLIAKINAALQRIEDGDYGYCDDTGDPINIKRLDARPIATLCIDDQ